MVAFSSLLSTGKYALIAGILLGYFGIVKPFRFYSRFIVYVLLVGVGGMYGVFISIFMTLIGKQGIAQHVTGRFFNAITYLVLGYKFVIKNEERLTQVRPAVFISNHQSDLDLSMLAATFPPWCSVTAKKSLKYYPILGWYMILSGTAFLDRVRRDKALMAFDEAHKIMEKKRQSVFMFPEGHRSYYKEPGLLPFKKGAFHFAIKAQVPIVPYVVQNYSRIWSRKEHIIEPGTILVEVLEPIETKGLTAADVNELIKKTEAVMLSAAQRLGHAERA